jgi:hypothetical protein
MTISVTDFQNEILINCGIHRWNPNLNAYLTLFAGAGGLGTDATTHDTTIQTPLTILQTNYPLNDRYQTDMANIINKGKAGGLTAAQMAAVLTTVQTLVPAAIPH